MLQHPIDTPVALGHAADLEPIQSLRRELAHELDTARTPLLRRSTRTWAGRISGRSDRRLMLAVAGAVDAIVVHCDHLVDELVSQQARTADVATAFGEDVTRLRSEVMRLQRLAGSLPPPQDE
jgi:hypothetical protein